MKSISDYLNFLRDKGLSLLEIFSGSDDEVVLAIKDTLHELNLLDGSQIVV